jgi:hypothetical protein
MNNLNAVMENAEAAAANYVPPAVVQSQVPMNQSSNVPAKQSLDDALNNGGLLVEEYILSKPEGLKISRDMKGLLESIDVVIDMSDVAVISQVRANSGGNTSFVKSYDGFSTSTGQNLEAEIRRLTQSHEKVDGPYTTVEIPVELISDVKDPKSSLTFAAGTELGYTPSMTGYKEFRRFMKALKKSGRPLDGVYNVRLHTEKKTNSNNNEWGVVRFELLVD